MKFQVQVDWTWERRLGRITGNAIEWSFYYYKRLSQACLGSRKSWYQRRWDWAIYLDFYICPSINSQAFVPGYKYKIAYKCLKLDRDRTPSWNGSCPKDLVSAHKPHKIQADKWTCSAHATHTWACACTVHACWTRYAIRFLAWFLCFEGFVTSFIGKTLIIPLETYLVFFRFLLDFYKKKKNRPEV